MITPKINTSFQQFLVILRAVRTLKDHLRFPIILPYMTGRSWGKREITSLKSDYTFVKAIRGAKVSCFYHL